jgi:hypothetical protein
VNLAHHHRNISEQGCFPQHSGSQQGSLPAYSGEKYTPGFHRTSFFFVFFVLFVVKNIKI